MMKILSALVVTALLLVGANSASAEQGPVMNGKKKPCVVAKTECPKEAEARAKAALALSAANKPTTSVTAKTTCKGDCKCLDVFGSCDCPPGSCPCCDKDKEKAPIPATKQPARTYFQRGNVIYECDGTTCRPVGTVGQK